MSRYLFIMMFAAYFVSSASAYQYEIIDIGGTASGINNDTVVVGTYGRDPYHWTQSTGRVRYSMVYDNWGLDINDAGIMVGHTKTTYDYGRIARYGCFAYNVWTGELVSSEVARTNWVAAVNNLNMTCGQNWLYDAPNGAHFGGYSYHPDGTGGSTGVGWGERNTAYDINDLGIAVGVNARVRTPEAWISLPTLGPGTNIAYGINDRWNGLGSGFICGQANNQPAYWDGHGNLHVLTAEGLISGALRRVNDHGQMVGTCEFDGLGDRAVIYKDGKLTILNDLLPISATLTSSVDINDRGQIVAHTSSGAVLLNPVFLQDGEFNLNSLGDTWVQSGLGTASISELGPDSFCMTMTAGSPVTVTHTVSTPSTSFEVCFDYQFLTADQTASLTVLLNGQEIAIVPAPSMISDTFTTYCIEINNADSQLFALENIPLAFRYDGPSGTSVQLDNVVIQQSLVPEPLSFWILALAASCLIRRESRS